MDNSTNTPVWRSLNNDVIKLQSELYELQIESMELGEKLGRGKRNNKPVKPESPSASLSLTQLASIKCSLIEAIYDIKFMISFRKTLLEQKKTP
jgi:hypothetical protein